MHDRPEHAEDAASGSELLREWLQTASNHVQVLPPRRADVWLDFNERSLLGAVVRETGGMLIDHGWLRLVGSESEGLSRSLSSWNIGKTTPDRAVVPSLLLVADDVVGGFYGVDWGALGLGGGAMHYFAPDALRWEPMEGFRYAEFLRWALKGNVADFYAELRWPGWESEAAAIRGDQSLSIVPPLWTSAGKRIKESSRRAVPVDEVFWLNVVDFPRQLGDAPLDCFVR